MPRMTALLSASIVALLLAACDGGVSRQGQYSAPDDPTIADESPVALVPYAAEGDGAAISGTLVLEDGCLYLRNGAQRILPLFPWPGTRWDPERQTLTVFEELTLRIGQNVSAGGGFIGDEPDGTRVLSESTARNTEVQGMMVLPRPRCDGTGSAAVLYFGRNPQLSPPADSAAPPTPAATPPAQPDAR